MPYIPGGIDLKKLTGEGEEFTIQLDDQNTEDLEDDDDFDEEVLNKFTKFSVLENENDYEEGEPFQEIAKKMTTLVENGIKKRIIREGYGNIPPDMAIVKIDFNAYLEYEPTPLDSTYARNRKFEFTLNRGEALPGVDIAVQSMKTNEKAQFLVEPRYAYGPIGCLDRVPPNATVLFEIELHQIIDSGAALEFASLSEEKQQEFSEIYKYCLALGERAKDKFKKNVRNAIKEYNGAISKLEMCQLGDISDQEKQQELLFRFYSNLLVCYVHENLPRKGCIVANKIHEMVKGTKRKIGAKIHFNHAKCFKMLGEYGRAKTQLKIAHSIEPKSPDIANEFIVLEEAIKRAKKSEEKFAKGFMGALNTDEGGPSK